MPQGYIEKDVFLERNDVTIYHAYKDNNYDNRLTYWYSVSATDEEGEGEFDVRELPCYGEVTSWSNEDDRHRQVIIKAIEQDLLPECDD